MAVFFFSDNLEEFPAIAQYIECSLNQMKKCKRNKNVSYYIVVGSQHQELGSLEHMLQILRFLEQHLREHTRKEGVSLAFAYISHYSHVLCNDLMLLNVLYLHFELAKSYGRNAYRHV